MNPPRIGVLPLYLELYDRSRPQLRDTFEPFLEQVAGGLRSQGLEVHRGPICRLRAEFAAAVAEFHRQDVDLLACVHLAYSPSLESADVLAASPLPLLLLDTTMDYDFGPAADPRRLSYNHGIHGVQDLACMLRRRSRSFQVVAGHVERSDVLARAADVARAARAARTFRSARILRIGPPFAGMGDFAVDDELLARRFGQAVLQLAPADLADAVRAVTDEQLEAELAADRQRFDVRTDEAVHRRSARLGLGLRRALDSAACSAMSMNFLAFDSPKPPVDTVPFLEISKAMARGIGYAGEGDVLTAGLVGGLLAGFARTTFTEMFCPDWKGGSLFLSHMGEINPAVAAAKPVLMEKQFPYTPAANPAFLAAAIAAGPAVLVNLAPGPDDSFSLIVAPVESLGDGSHPELAGCVRGWIRPRIGLAEFLERYSKLGGTHHSALVLGAGVEAIAAFADFAGIEHEVVR